MKKAGEVNLKVFVFLIIFTTFFAFSFDMATADEIIGSCPDDCMCYLEDNNYCAGQIGGSFGFCSRNIKGQQCAEGYICSNGECVELGSNNPCSYGEAEESCNCREEVIDSGQYCCDSGPQSESCEDSFYLNYKWYPSQETDNPNYCGFSGIGCPNPNPFLWNNKLTSDISFLYSSDYDTFFEVIPLFDKYYYLGEYWPLLVDYMTDEDSASDSLSDYPLHIESYERLSGYVRPSDNPMDFIYDYHFCALPDSDDGPFATILQNDNGEDGKILHDCGGSAGGGNLELYCRNNIIRVCLHNEPCPWRTDINSADDATCLPFNKRHDGSYCENSETMVQINHPELDHKIYVPELANSGEGYFQGFIFCGAGHDGWSYDWYLPIGYHFGSGPYGPTKYELTLNLGYPDNTNEFELVNGDYYHLEYNDSIIFPDPDDKSGDYCNEDNLGYSEIERYWDSEIQECAGDDFIAEDYYKSNPDSVPEEGAENYRPDFLYQIVDEPDFIEGFCLGSSIGFNYGYRAWLEGQQESGYCCGDDDGNLYYDYDIEGNLEKPTQEEIESGFSNYADCAKIVNDQYLCNVGGAVSPEGMSKWEDALLQEGDIVYLPCYPATIGSELVSTGSSWMSCGQFSEPSQYQHQFYGSYFTSSEQRIEFTDNSKHSYLCSNPETVSGLDSISECCEIDESSCKSGKVNPEAGEQYTTGQYKEIIEHNTRYYCAINSDKNPAGDIITGPDVQSTLWTDDLDFTNKDSCEAAEFDWTGVLPYHNSEIPLSNLCCGEYDDTIETKNGDILFESYNDNDGNGACFDAVYQPNDNFIEYQEKTYNETIVINGNILGCAIDEDNAINTLQCSGQQGSCDSGVSYKNNRYEDDSKPFLDNNWLLELENWPNPGQIDSSGEPLIQDSNYCTIITDSNNEQYYCSYNEIWEETDEDKSHLSFIEWMDSEEWQESPKTMAGCCLPEQCWTGEECVESQHDNPMLLPYGTEEEPYRCIHGAWQFSNLKYTWDKEQSGYCQNNDQCLVNPSGQDGNPNNPQCINSDNFIGDHYCEEGIWTTRTKKLALQLLEIAPSNQKYTLYCDSYDKTLNKYDYNDIESFILYPRINNGSTFNSVNNFCILRYDNDDKIIIATSLNHPIWDTEANFLTVFNQNIKSCPTGHEGFDQCDTQPSFLYYNEEINSIIYSKIQISFPESTKNIFDIFQNIFDFIVDAFGSGLGLGNDYDFIQQTSDFNQVYFSNQEQIAAVRESVFPGQEHITVRYWGLGSDVCESISAYNLKLGSSEYVKCIEEDGFYYITSNLPEGINIWSLTTAKLRPERAE